jgi:hypothetical protein
MESIIRKAIVAASCLALAAAGAQAKAKEAKQEAEVQCKDGTTSKAGRGACSHHGGVAAATPAEPARDRQTASKEKESPGDQQPAEVQCKDGTTSRAGRGACSHHGGVAAATPAEPAREKAPASDTRDRSEEASRPAESQATPQGRAPATAPQRAPAAGQPTARCKDGTMSYSQHRSGTCSRHGGVAEWLTR